MIINVNLNGLMGIVVVAIKFSLLEKKKIMSNHKIIH